MKDLTIKYTATVREAMEALEKTAEKVLLVVGNDNKMIGTLTDGDIRRYILQGHDLNGTVAKAYNHKPIYIFEKDYNLAFVKALLTEKKIDLIPILDEDYGVVDYVTWGKAFGNGEISLQPPKTLNLPVVIMAGGKGTRLEPFTKVLPKPLIPVEDKPIIDHIIDKFLEYGIKEYFLTLNHKSKIIKAYFEEKNTDYSIKFAEEDRPLGTAGSLKLLIDKINSPFFVTNCDVIIDMDYADLYEFHKNHQFDITLVASVKHYNIPYGICELENDGVLAAINEKPEYSFLVNTGLYVLNHSVIKFIPENESFDLTLLINVVKESGGKIGVYPISENSWIDVGQWAEYHKAVGRL